MRRPSLPAGLARRHLVALALAAFAVLSSAGPVAAGEVVGDLELEALPVFPGERCHGYVEYRVRIINNGGVPHQVTLALPPDNAMGVVGWMQLRREVEVPAGATVEVALRQPPLPMWASSVAARIDGGRSVGVGIPASGSFQTGNAAPTGSALVLASSRLPVDVLPLAPTAPAEATVAPTPEPAESESPAPAGAVPAALLEVQLAAKAVAAVAATMTVMRAELPPAAWSPSWLAYTGFDGVVLGTAELASAPAPVREALRRYVEAGGVLLLVGPGPAAALLGLPRVEGEAAAGTAAGEGHLAEQPLGFGTLMVTTSPTLGLDEATQLSTALARHRQRWTAGRDPQAAQRALPIRTALIPVRGLFLFIVGFVATVGPVNLFVLARWKRRIWVLATVPALALLATAGVTVYAWLAEGVVRERSTTSLTLLDQQTRRAATWALSGVYTTFTPSEGLRYGADTEVTPMLPSLTEGGGTFGVDWTAEQRLVPGWLVARAPLHLLTRSVTQRRERLLVSRTGDGIEVQNALGAALERVVVSDAAGRLYEGGRIAAGARATLRALAAGAAGEEAAGEAATAEAAAQPSVAGELIAYGLSEAARRVAERPRRFARPGTYVAILAGDPFAEEGLARARTVTARAVVHGRLAEGDL
jgi:hypothetical protein